MSVGATVVRAAEIAGKVLPSMLRWIVSQLDGGYDPEAELKAMFAAGDATVEELQRRKFGSRR